MLRTAAPTSSLRFVRTLTTGCYHIFRSYVAPALSNVGPSGHCSPSTSVRRFEPQLACSRSERQPTSHGSTVLGRLDIECGTNETPGCGSCRITATRVSVARAPCLLHREDSCSNRKYWAFPSSSRQNAAPACHFHSRRHNTGVLAPTVAYPSVDRFRSLGRLRVALVRGSAMLLEIRCLLPVRRRRRAGRSCTDRVASPPKMAHMGPPTTAPASVARRTMTPVPWSA